MKALNRIKSDPKLGLVLLIYIAFIALGMPDGLMGVAWPSIRQSFSIPLDALGSLLLVSTTGYLISSSLSGRLIAIMGVGRMLSLSCVLTGVALLGYTLVPTWWMMVGLGSLAGLGAGAIDSGLNTYVASHYSERLMQWLHASYGLGVTIGPLVMTFALNSFQSWQAGFRIVSFVQFVLGISFVLTLPLWRQQEIAPGAEKPKRLTDYKTPLGETLSQSRVWLSLVQFFLYTGTETALGTWAYTLLTEARHVQPAQAGLVVGSYWAMFTIGRVVAGLYARRVEVKKMVLAGYLLGLGGAALLWWNPAPIANLAAVGIAGFAVAPIFPGLVSRTSHRVGLRYAANTIGMQMAAASLGAASVPSLVGVLAHQVSLEAIPVSFTVLFILLVGLFGLSEANPAP